jgi:hypothetical protein
LKFVISIVISSLNKVGFKKEGRILKLADGFCDGF